MLTRFTLDRLKALCYPILPLESNSVAVTGALEAASVAAAPDLASRDRSNQSQTFEQGTSEGLLARQTGAILRLGSPG